MRKGIVATIVIYSLVQVLGTLIWGTFFKIFPILFTFNLSQNYPILKLLSAILFSAIGFVLLGFHLNNKYAESLKYSKFVTIGFLVSIIPSILTIVAIGFILESQGKTQISFFHNIVLTLLLTFSHTIVCSIVAIFHKRYKSKKKIFHYE